MAAANVIVAEKEPFFVKPDIFWKIMRQPCMRSNTMANHVIAKPARIGMALMGK